MCRVCRVYLWLSCYVGNESVLLSSLFYFFKQIRTGEIVKTSRSVNIEKYPVGWITVAAGNE